MLESGSLVQSIKDTFSILFYFLLSIKISIFTFGNQTSEKKFYRVIKLLSLIKGKYYVIPNYSAPMPWSFFEGYYLNALMSPSIRTLLGKDKGSKFNAYVDKNLIGTLLLQSNYDNKRANLFGSPKQRLYMGYYKLYKPWSNLILNNTMYESDKLKNASECIVVVAKRSGRYFFDSDDVYMELLNETINSIRKYYPSTLIVFKPKAFKVIESNDWVEPYIESLGDKSIVVDYTPLAFTASKTIFAVFNIASTAYFDFVIQNVPCIEHSRYGENYLSINKGGSYMQEYGATKTETKQELNNAIELVKNQSLSKMKPDDLKSKISHTENYDSFANF